MLDACAYKHIGGRFSSPDVLPVALLTSSLLLSSLPSSLVSLMLSWLPFFYSPFSMLTSNLQYKACS